MFHSLNDVCFPSSPKTHLCRSTTVLCSFAFFISCSRITLKFSSLAPSVSPLCWYLINHHCSSLPWSRASSFCSSLPSCQRCLLRCLWRETHWMPCSWSDTACGLPVGCSIASPPFICPLVIFSFTTRFSLSLKISLSLLSVSLVSLLTPGQPSIYGFLTSLAATKASHLCYLDVVVPVIVSNHADTFSLQHSSSVSQQPRSQTFTIWRPSTTFSRFLKAICFRATAPSRYVLVGLWSLCQGIGTCVIGSY